MVHVKFFPNDVHQSGGLLGLHTKAACGLNGAWTTAKFKQHVVGLGGGSERVRAQAQQIERQIRVDASGLEPQITSLNRGTVKRSDTDSILFACVVPRPCYFPPQVADQSITATAVLMRPHQLLQNVCAAANVTMLDHVLNLRA